MGGPRRWDGKQGTLEQRTTETPGNTDTSNNQIQMHKYTWTSCDAAQYKRNNKQKISRLDNILWSNTHEDIYKQKGVLQLSRVWKQIFVTNKWVPDKYKELGAQKSKTLKTYFYTNEDM